MLKLLIDHTHAFYIDTHFTMSSVYLILQPMLAKQIISHYQYSIRINKLQNELCLKDILTIEMQAEYEIY